MESRVRSKVLAFLRQLADGPVSRTIADDDHALRQETLRSVSASLASVRAVITGAEAASMALARAPSMATFRVAASHVSAVLHELRFDRMLSHTGNQYILSVAAQLSKIVDLLTEAPSTLASQITGGALPLDGGALGSVRADLTSCIDRLHSLSKILEEAVSELTVAPVPISAAFKNIMNYHLVSAQLRSSLQRALSGQGHDVALARLLFDELFPDCIVDRDGDALHIIQCAFDKCKAETQCFETFVHELQQAIDGEAAAIKRAAILLGNIQQISAYAELMLYHEESLHQEELMLRKVREAVCLLISQCSIPDFFLNQVETVIEAVITDTQIDVSPPVGFNEPYVSQVAAGVVDYLRGLRSAVEAGARAPERPRSSLNSQETIRSVLYWIDEALRAAGGVPIPSALQHANNE
jgi:hypothetical protein